MKKVTFIFCSCVAMALVITSCKESNSEKGEVTTEVVDATPKEFLFADSKVSYNSNYTLVKNVKKSETVKMVNPNIVEAAYYDLNMPKEAGMAGVNCQKIKGDVNIEKMLDAVIGSYAKIKDVKLDEQSITDVSATVGLNAKLAKGKILFDDYKGGFTTGEYSVMVVEKGKEAFLFQGLFEKEGSPFAIGFSKMLNDIKVIDSGK